MRDRKLVRRFQVGKMLDGLGVAYRLSRARQARTKKLLTAKQHRSLTAQERRELRELLRECDAILSRRAAALDRLP